LKIADEKGIKTIAFPNISTGVYGYPKEEAAEIAVDAVKKYLRSSKIKKVIFCVFNDENFRIYKKLLSQ
jgi:O-acetyl-ADP-ribose deacetylase (regulator of RNase III)